MKHTKQRILSLVDKSTGEVANGIVELTVTKRYLPKFYSTFAKSYKDIRKLTPGARNLFEDLCAYMERGNRIKASRSQLAKEFNLKRDSTDRWVAQLIKADFLIGSGNYYVVNPKYALNGGRAYFIQAHHEYGTKKMDCKVRP